MGLWENISRLARLGPIQGVQNPGPVDVLTPAQLVVLGDDVSYTVPPTLIPDGLRYGDVPVVALERGALAISAGPSGTTIRTVAPTSSSGPVVGDIAFYTILSEDVFNLFDTEGLTANVFQGFNTQTPLHSLRGGTIGATPYPATSAFQAFDPGILHLDWHIAPGTALILHSAAVATIFRLVLWIQDVPA